MPVVRGRSTTIALTPERRAQLRERLASELSGEGTPDGPLIFEIPLEQSDKIDVIVIWNEFEGVPVEDRDQVILDAYQDRSVRVAMAMGVTHQQANDQHLLPYGVVPTALPGEVNLTELRGAMRDEGGIARENGTVDLRFPTLAMAEAAQKKLSERLPGVSWEIWDAIAAVKIR
jgi:hypothetical protein